MVNEIDHLDGRIDALRSYRKSVAKLHAAARFEYQRRYYGDLIADAGRKLNAVQLQRDNLAHT